MCRGSCDTIKTPRKYERGVIWKGERKGRKANVEEKEDVRK